MGPKFQLFFRFSRWWPQQRHFTTAFGLDEVDLFGWKSISKPNFVEITQLIISCFEKNILLPVSILTIGLLSQWACYSAAGGHISPSPKSGHPRRSNDVLRFQNCSRGGSILLPASYLLTSLSSECQSLPANQISSTYLNSWLKYNYFQLRNKLLPYWNSTSCFDFDRITTVGMLFCIRLPNFIQIGFLHGLYNNATLICPWFQMPGFNSSRDSRGVTLWVPKVAAQILG